MDKDLLPPYQVTPLSAGGVGKEEALKLWLCWRVLIVLYQKVAPSLAVSRGDVGRRQQQGTPQNEQLPKKRCEGSLGAQGFKPPEGAPSFSVLFTLCPAALPNETQPGVEMFSRAPWNHIMLV